MDEKTLNDKTLREKIIRLNEISVMIDKADIDLEKAMDLYSEGVSLADNCIKQLEDAKQKIITLSINEDDE